MCNAAGNARLLSIRHRLRFHRKLSRLEGMLLGHGVFGAVDAVEDQVAEEGESGVFQTLDFLFFRSVHQKDFAGRRFARHVHIFTDFHGSFGADYKCSTVAPAGGSVRRKPIEAAVE